MGGDGLVLKKSSVFDPALPVISSRDYDWINRAIDDLIAQVRRAHYPLVYGGIRVVRRRLTREVPDGAGKWTRFKIRVSNKFAGSVYYLVFELVDGLKWNTLVDGHRRYIQEIRVTCIGMGRNSWLWRAEINAPFLPGGGGVEK